MFSSFIHSWFGILWGTLRPSIRTELRRYLFISPYCSRLWLVSNKINFVIPLDDCKFTHTTSVISLHNSKRLHVYSPKFPSYQPSNLFRPRGILNTQLGSPSTINIPNDVHSQETHPSGPNFPLAMNCVQPHKNAKTLSQTRPTLNHALSKGKTA